MTKQSNTQTPNAAKTATPGEWQQACLASARIVGTSWLDFMGERFQAYVHAIDEFSHCHDLNEAWRVQATFGQETIKAYGAQATKLGSMVLKATDGDAGARSHLDA